MSYRVFLNAPTATDLKKNAPGAAFSWRTAASQDEHDEDGRPVKQVSFSEDTEGWLLPPATFGVASRRISEIYKNVIFPEDDRDGEEWDECKPAEEGGNATDQSNMEESFVSWPPTNAQSRASLSRRAAASGFDSRDYSWDASCAHTSTSSITAFPAFVINLHTLAELSDLTAERTRSEKWSRKVNLLVAILEVEGPDFIRIKRGPDTGREVAVLKLVIGSEKGEICKVTAWRETAEVWGGVGEPDFDESMLENEGVKKGDIVYIENILASAVSPTSGEVGQQVDVSLTASPSLGSRLHICFRTLPTLPADRRFRPDLRLAVSDPGLRKVAGVAHWLENTVGLSK